MPIAIACPSCKARLQAPDSAVGKRVKCPKCQTPIPVPDAGESPAPAKQSPAPSKAPAKKNAPDNDFNFDDDDDRPAKKGAPAKRRDDDEEDDRPSKKGGAIKKSRDDDYDDDDRPSKKGAVKKSRDDDYDDDDRPSKKGAPAKRGRDDDYDDDDDDRPKKKSKKGRPAGNFPTPTQEDMTNAFNMYLYTFLAGLIGSFVGLSWAAPIVFLVMWFSKKKESPLVDFHGKQGVNAFISNLLASFVLLGLACAGMLGIGAMGSGDPNSSMPLIGMLVGLLFGGLWGIYYLWLGIAFFIGMFKAKAGVYWKWPMTMQLLK